MSTMFLTFLITKTCSKIWNIAFCKNVYIFWYSNDITNFKFRIVIINFFTRVNIYVWFRSRGFTFLALWYVLLYLFTMSLNISINTFFDIEAMYFYILFFKVLINLSATTNFSSLFVEYISIAFFSNNRFIDLL